jgi:AcrR family transcriptional regulator
MIEPTARQRRKEARPQELLEAALSLFVEKGFASTRSEEVAARAGVSKGTLYLYFPSKEDLFKAVVQQTLAADIAEGARVMQSHTGTAAEILVDVLVEWWTRIYEGPGSGVFKLVVTEMRNFPELAQFYAQEVVEPGCGLIAGMVERGIAQGEFRQVDVAHATQSIVLPMIMLCLHKHSIGACGFQPPAAQHPHEFIRQHLQLLLRGLQAHPSAGTVAPAPQHEPPSRLK